MDFCFSFLDSHPPSQMYPIFTVDPCSIYFFIYIIRARIYLNNFLGDQIFSLKSVYRRFVYLVSICFCFHIKKTIFWWWMPCQDVLQTWWAHNFFKINISIWFSGFKEIFLWVWYLYNCIILLGLQTLTTLFLFVEYIFKVIKASSYSLSFRIIILSYIQRFCSTLNFLKIKKKMLKQTFSWKLEKKYGLKDFYLSIRIERSQSSFFNIPSCQVTL